MASREFSSRRAAGFGPSGHWSGSKGSKSLQRFAAGRRSQSPGKVVSIWRASSSALCLRSSIATRRIKRVSAAQRLHRDEDALVRRAELDHAADALAALVRERGARDEAAQAVADDHDVLPPLAQQAVGELAAVPEDVAAPVVGMEDGIEAGDAQHEPQPLVGELEDADRPVAVAGGQGELHELALGRSRPGRTR